MTDLKPCPFCGEKAGRIVRFGNQFQSTQYECDYCGCLLETREISNYGDEWNTRHREAKLEAEIAKLRAALNKEEKYLHSLIDDEDIGGVMHGDIEGAFHRIREGDFGGYPIEAEIADLRAKLAAEQTRRQQADLTIQAIGMKLGTTDEWTDAETMDADVLRAASTYEGQLTAEEMRERCASYITEAKNSMFPNKRRSEYEKGAITMAEALSLAISALSTKREEG